MRGGGGAAPGGGGGPRPRNPGLCKVMRPVPKERWLPGFAFLPAIP